jgi:catechol 2,3-dioxygenase-like lactoylglutathione lyase family enzyme
MITIATNSGLQREIHAGYAPDIEKEAAMIRGIKFVSIPVGDQDVSLKFYSESLGFKVVTDQPFTDSQRWIELLIPGADTGIALFTPEGHENRIGEFQSISFWCDDVFATAEVLKSKGVAFAKEPKNEVWGSSAVFKDPDGNRFVLSSKGKK